jgi:predicted tellurium resistance membrane protein TerC
MDWLAPMTVDLPWVLAAAESAKGIETLWSAEALIAFLTLSALEIVLGIDNIVFIAILAAKLPKEQQAKARNIGLTLAMVTRILLLLAIGWIMGLTRILFSLPFMGEAGAISGRDLILFLGGLFLVGKATYEIHDKLEGSEHGAGGAAKATAAFGTVIVQILLLDIVFSLDSVITAVGMVQTSPENKWVGLSIMIAAVILAIGVMLAFAGVISRFVERHPTVKMLALSFLILIGVVLVSEAFNVHVPKGYIYFSMAFALGVELLNLRLRKVGKPVALHQSYVASETTSGYGDVAGTAPMQVPLADRSPK